MHQYIIQGLSVLMIASLHGSVDIVRILIEAKAQVNTQWKVYYSHCQKTHYMYIQHTHSVILLYM